MVLRGRVARGRVFGENDRGLIRLYDTFLALPRRISLSPRRNMYSVPWAPMARVSVGFRKS